MVRVSIPLRERKVDAVFILFFAVNLFFITYIVDFEQLAIADPAPGHFEYPLWPPKWGVDLVHWYAFKFDPPLIHREAWWRATIWIDSLWFGPFYALAIYAFARGCDWIRVPAFVWAGNMISNVLIILMEELVGRHPTPEPGFVLAVNGPWLLLPFGVIYRLARSNHPFTVKKPAATKGKKEN